MIVTGYAVLAVSGTRPALIVSAIVFGSGFGSAYPVFLAYLMRHVDESRRGAMFGSIIGAFDTGIGTGSIVMGLIIQRYGFQAAWGTAAALAACSVPYFLVAQRRL
jgi:predicted MFS family arabinose efflux permease